MSHPVLGLRAAAYSGCLMSSFIVDFIFLSAYVQQDAILTRCIEPGLTNKPLNTSQDYQLSVTVCSCQALPSNNAQGRCP